MDAGTNSSNEKEEAPPIIQPIDPQAIQRIVAGQAVTDLTSAVKELVDNAIDAGSKRIVVKLVNQGLEAIEVSDNGSGVPSSSRPMMGMKHATSKLRQFDDLYSDQTTNHGGKQYGEDGDNHYANEETNKDYHSNDYDCAPTLGFRGEALFCLSNISRSLSVSTKSTDDKGLGEAFSFDQQGQLISNSIKKVPRPVGTTVTVHGLFEALPVRRVDLCKRIKGQRTKLMKMMQGYAILCLSTQFNLTDTQSSTNKGKGKRGGNKAETRIATSESSKTLESRVSSILGTKFLSGLCKIEVDLTSAVDGSSTSSEKETEQSAQQATRKGGRWKLTGLISHSPTSKSHPSTARDLQFFSINGRPVDLPSVSKVVGDVWRMFDPTSEIAESGKKGTSGGRRRPACILQFTLPNSMYDVNLSPDKREVLFTNEVATSELIRESLMQLWSEQSEGSFKANEVETKSNQVKKSKSRAAVEEETNEDGEAGNDEVVDHVTPKLSRRNADSAAAVVDEPRLENDQRFVTPHHSNKKTGQQHSGIANTTIAEPLSEEIEGNQSPTADPAFEEKTSQPHNQASNTAEESHTNNDTSTIEAESEPHKRGRGWDQMNLPERARQQQEPKQLQQRDRREWEQMRINFQRIEKNELREDMSHMMSHSNENEDLQESEEEEEDDELHTNSSKPTIKQSERINTGNSKRNNRQAPKRTKAQKQDVSFLDSFAYGATTEKSTDADDSSGEDDQSEDSEEEVVEEVQNQALERPKRSLSRDRGDNTAPKNKRNVRMVMGTTASSSEKRPRNASVSSASNNGRNERGDPSAEEDGEPNANHGLALSPQPQPEVVWNSFSGTKNVMAQAQHARLMMKRNGILIRSSLNKLKRNDTDGEEPEGTNNESSTTNAKKETVNLTKEDFLHMSIIGQFNLGFILARCRNNHLWILDQHGCDEKYNFERLLKETVMHEQTLIAPLPLELSPSEEHTIMENLDLFERNGFRFKYDETKEVRFRLALTALPHSGTGKDGKKAVQFGVEDVGALCAMLGADGTSSSEGFSAGFGNNSRGAPKGDYVAGVNAVRRFAGLDSSIVGKSIVRLPKAVAMFANRACRGSIMIGTALSHKEQMNILKKLDKTDIPWNCAHGRPTMSHIRSLAKCLKDDDDALAAHVAGPSLSVVSEDC